MPDIKMFPEYFRNYSWKDKHHLYGYPADCYGDFAWISSLEVRFKWLRLNHATANTASIYLVREMIQWGGSQNGVLQKFDDGLGEVNLYEAVDRIIAGLSSPEKAIAAALGIQGMGLTYASKVLRFLDPENFGALDSRIRGALEAEAPEAKMPKIYDSNTKSRINGYKAFIDYIEILKGQLDVEKIPRPDCALPLGSCATGWRAADIEMALFKWAEST